MSVERRTLSDRASPTVADLEAITAIYATYVATGTASFELEPPD